MVLGKEKVEPTTARFTLWVLNVVLKEIETKIPLITSELNNYEIQSKSDRISNPQNR